MHNIKFNLKTFGFHRGFIRCSCSCVDFSHFLTAYQPSEVFFCWNAFTTFIPYLSLSFADKFPNMIFPKELFFSFYKRTPETLSTCSIPLFSLFQKAIPPWNEIWNCNSAGDKYYEALLWIINESRRSLVLPALPEHDSDRLVCAGHGLISG